MQLIFAQELSITKVNIIGDFEVYASTYYLQDIVVCSNKKDEVFYTITDASKKYPINLYLIELKNKDSLILNTFDKAFRTKLNDGPITFNKKYTECFISQNYQNLKKENNNLKLEYYIYKNGAWIKSDSFKYNNQTYSLTHPALNEEGNTLIFSSNMPGGYGGFDLWKSVKVNGEWSSPINLGSNINSPSNEFFPTLVQKELYFSSDRDGYGGLDIYKTNLSENNPSILLPQPINSNFDDFSLISKSSLGDGYFSSNRDGKDAIYQFEYIFPKFNNCDSIVDNNFCYTLYEESALAIPNQEALIYKWTINGEKRKGAEIRYCFPGPGNYEIILDVEDTISHIKYDNQSHMNITLDNVMKPYITSIDTIQVNTKFYLSAVDSYLPYLNNKKYFWTIENKNMVGEHVAYAFNHTGEYQIQLGVVGYEDTIKVTDCVFKTIKDKVYFISQNEGLFVYDNDKINSIGKFKQELFFTFNILNENTILLGTNNGLLIISNSSGRWETKQSILDIEVSSILITKQNKIIIGTNNGKLLFVEIKGQSIKSMPVVKSLNISYPIKKIIEDKSNDLWIATAGEGVLKIGDYLYEQPNIDYYNASNGLPSNFIQTIYQDREDNIWIGSFGSGLFSLTERNFLFYNQLKYNDVKSIQVNKNTKWFGTDNGLIEILPNDSMIIYDSNNKFIDDEITDLQLFDSILWIGTYSRGIYNFDLRTETFTKLKWNFGSTLNRINDIIVEKTEYG